MPLRQYLFAAALACAALAPATLMAPPVAAAQSQFNQVKLDKEMVSRFLASYPKFRALSKKYEAGAPARGSHDGDGPVSSLSGFLQQKAARSEVDKILAAHGFSGFPEWLAVARSVAVAYGFVKSGKSPQQLGGQAERALAAIRSSDHLSSEQKKQMEAMVAQQLGRLKKYEPLPANLEIAREMRSEIATVMDIE